MVWNAVHHPRQAGAAYALLTGRRHEYPIPRQCFDDCLGAQDLNGNTTTGQHHLKRRTIANRCQSAKAFRVNLMALPSQVRGRIDNRIYEACRATYVYVYAFVDWPKARLQIEWR